MRFRQQDTIRHQFGLDTDSFDISSISGGPVARVSGPRTLTIQLEANFFEHDGNTHEHVSEILYNGLLVEVHFSSTSIAERMHFDGARSYCVEGVVTRITTRDQRMHEGGSLYGMPIEFIGETVRKPMDNSVMPSPFSRHRKMTL